MQRFADMPRLYMAWILHHSLRGQNACIAIEKVKYERDEVGAVVESRLAALLS